MHSTSTNGSQKQVILVGSPEWEKLTERRAELIYKKNRQGLTEAENLEFDTLQSLSRAAINHTFPSPTVATTEGTGR